MKNRTGFALLAATVVLGMTVSAQAAPVDTPITLGIGWNQIGLPTVPLNPDPASVFADLAGTQDIEGAFSRYDAVLHSNVQWYSFDNVQFGNMLIGDGYWVLKTTPGSLVNHYQGVDVSGDHWISLPRTGWTMIGYPNNTPTSVPLDNVQVTDGIQTWSYQDAADAGKVSDTVVTYDNTLRSNINVTTSVNPIGESFVLEKGKGYWILSNQDNLALIIPGS